MEVNAYYDTFITITYNVNNEGGGGLTDVPMTLCLGDLKVGCFCTMVAEFFV